MSSSEGRAVFTGKHPLRMNITRMKGMILFMEKLLIEPIASRYAME
jgi:hypothetical protein